MTKTETQIWGKSYQIDRNPDEEKEPRNGKEIIDPEKRDISEHQIAGEPDMYLYVQQQREYKNANQNWTVGFYEWLIPKTTKEIKKNK